MPCSSENSLRCCAKLVFSGLKCFKALKELPWLKAGLHSFTQSFPLALPLPAASWGTSHSPGGCRTIHRVLCKHAWWAGSCGPPRWQCRRPAVIRRTGYEKTPDTGNYPIFKSQQLQYAFLLQLTHFWFQAVLSAPWFHLLAPTSLWDI